MKAKKIRRINNNLTNFKDSIIFLGQVLDDSSLVTKRGLVSTEEIIECIKALSLRTEFIYFKPHPLYKNKDFIDCIKKAVPEIKITEENIYDLFCYDVAEFAAMSSGSIYEARYFHKKGNWYLPNKITQRYFADYYIPIYGYPFSRNFIQFILGQTEIIDTSLFSNNPLKEILEIRWGR